jgi:hypothetical protein
MRAHFNNPIYRVNVPKKSKYSTSSLCNKDIDNNVLKTISKVA